MDLKKRFGLSNIVSTLVVLVVAVLLAGLATYFGVNTTTTRTSYESLQFDSEHVWVNGTGCVAAARVQAVGGKDLLIDKITVRTLDCQWSNVYYYRVPLNTEISNDMNLTSSALLTGASVTLFGKEYIQATDDLLFTSGGEVLFYVKNPEYIGIDDIGTIVNINIFTNNAEYVIEINVESATSN